VAKRVLLVDDSASVRQVAGLTLRGAGYEIVESCDGRDALDKLNGERIHLIVSDVNMPNMDGITFLKQVRQLPAYKFTPIIMLTTEAGRDMMDQGRTAGAKAWIIKPFQPQALLDAVSKLLA
jgi:two-component system chemotaxis response regulator CheY